MSWDLQVVPRGVSGQSQATNGPGKSWTGSHGYVGTGIGRSTVFGVDVPEMTVNDGVNDAGVYAIALYLPGYTEYEPAEGVDAASLLSPMDMVAFVLATAGSVAEAVAAIESVVIEWVGGVRHVHHNVMGVCTNSPTFDPRTPFASTRTLSRGGWSCLRSTWRVGRSPASR